MKPVLRAWLFMPLFAGGVLFVWADYAEAQRTRPGGGISGTRPGGGISGTRPGGVTGGVTGMTRPGTNIGTNIGNPPGGGNFGGGNFNGGNIGGGAIGGGAIGGGPAFERTWNCPNCNREVGRGNSPPASVTCCGKTYVNGRSLGNFGGGAIGGGAIGGNPPGGGIPPGTNPPGGGMNQFGGGMNQLGGINQPGNNPPGNNQPGNNPPGGGVFGNNPPANNFPSSNTSAEVDKAARTVTGGMIAAGISSLLFGLAILGSVVFLVINNSRVSAPAPSRRRSRD